MNKFIAYIFLGLLGLVGVAYFLFRKKNTSTDDNTSYDGFFNKSIIPKANQDTTATATTTGSTATTISLANVSLVTSPLIGKFHLTAEITLGNPPATGSLLVLLGNINITEITLPLSSSTYYLDEYVTASAGSTYNLTAKVGSITKSVQITI